MNARQAASLNRYNAVIAQLSNETAAIATVPAAKRTFDGFTAKVAAINSLIPKQGEKSSPFTHSKTSARAALVSTYTDLAALVYAWADERGDTTIRHKYDLAPSDISRLKDSVLPNEAEAFYHFLQAHVAELVDYGIIDAVLEDFALDINQFSEAASLPRTTITTRSTQVKNLATLFAEADHLLQDRLMNQLVAIRKNHPDVYTTFISNCKTIAASGITAKRAAAKKAAKAAAVAKATVIAPSATAAVA